MRRCHERLKMLLCKLNLKNEPQTSTNCQVRFFYSICGLFCESRRAVEKLENYRIPEKTIATIKKMYKDIHIEVSTPSWRSVDHLRGPQQTPAIFAQTPTYFGTNPLHFRVVVRVCVFVCGAWCVVFSPCWERPRPRSICSKFLYMDINVHLSIENAEFL